MIYHEMTKKRVLNVLAYMLVAASLVGLEWLHYKGNEPKILRYYYFTRIYHDLSENKSFNQFKNDSKEFITLTFPEMAEYGLEKELFDEALTIDSERDLDLTEFTDKRPEIIFAREEWGKYYYALGVEQFNQGHQKEAEFALVSAVRIDPYWSYFWIELGNYYARMGNMEKVRAVGSFCTYVRAMKDHCAQNFSADGSLIKVEPVGFLHEEIFQKIN